jgi:small GTP-binding protein
MMQSLKRTKNKFPQINNVKCIFLGSSGVGKSSLIDRFINDYFEQQTQSTHGVAFFTKYINFDTRTIKLDIWDTAGQERYNSLMPLYYRGASIVIVVFEIGSSKTFNRAKLWIDEIKNHDYEKHPLILLLGNKYDGSNDTIIIDEYKLYAASKKISFSICSAKTGLNVKLAITDIIEQYEKNTHLLNIKEESSSNAFNLSITSPESRVSCCASK